MRRIGHNVQGFLRHQPYWLWGVALSLASLGMALVIVQASIILLSLLLAGTLLHLIRQEYQLARIAQEIGAERTFPLSGAVRKRCLQLVEANRAVAQRLAQRHGVSGLPTRELLIIAMNTGPGVLGIVEFVDYDRLCASDPDRADAALGEIANRIARMVGIERMVAHVDRARFAIWFDSAPEEEARTALQAISYSLQDRMIIGGEPLLPVIRLGHLHCDPDMAPADKLLARAFAILASQRLGADSALEAASTAIKGDFALEQDLRRALVSGEFELWFQPFVDARRRVVCGAEALIRWRHPVRGLISPAAFVPMAEAAGLAEEMGIWVLDTACRAACAWSAGGLPKVKVAVNVSGHQVERPGLGQLVSRTLSRHGLPPNLLELELTETVAAVDSRAAADLLDRLRALGTSVSIDDFGTGYSSLSYLKNLSFDKLKIDREFVTDVDRRQDCQAICESIIALGRGLGISVLAEGVEREEEMTWLRDHGCHLYQGYYFARPMPEAEFVAFAKDRKAMARLLDPAPVEIMKRIAG